MKNDFNITSSDEQTEKKSAKNDSLLGGLLFECFCGGALEELFAEAVDLPDWMRELDDDIAMELYEQYVDDRTNGGFKLGVKNSLNGNFNSLGPSFPLHQAQDSSYGISQMTAKGQGSYAVAGQSAPSLH